MALKLVDIAADCLLKIFEHLTIFELSDVASTCTRFNNIARENFQLYHKTISLDINAEAREQHGYNRCLARRRQINGIFRNFGDLSTKLRVNFMNPAKKFYNTRVFNSMVMYCCGPLEVLELRNCKNLESEKTIDARALFRNVKKLILYRSTAVKGFFLSEATEMKTLSLTGYYSMEVAELLHNDYPNLQSLTVAESFGPDQLQTNDNLKHHQNLVELELSSGCIYVLSLVRKSQRLRRLSVWNCESWETAPIVRLDNLIALKLSTDVGGRLPMELLKRSMSSESLEELILSGYMDLGMDLVTVLLSFSNMKRLSIPINGAIIYDDLLSGFHRMGELRVLSIGGRMSITDDGLVDLVQRLPHLEQLSLHPDCYNKYMQLRKSTYLRVYEICQTRTQKLMICNYDATSGTNGDPGKDFDEPFAECKHHETVQFVSFQSSDPHREDFPI